jgi:hypothetical protein
VTAEKQNAFLVPASAVSGTALWVVRDEKLVNVSIQLGINGRDRVEIAAGLAEDDRVLVNPPPRLKSGQRVRVRIEPPATASQPDRGVQR